MDTVHGVPGETHYCFTNQPITFDMSQSRLILAKFADIYRTRSRRVNKFPTVRLTLLIVAALVAAVPALAHSWYPLACCGNMDCFPIACDQLVETVSGWLYVPTGNLFKREQVQPSQDQHCHVCLGRGIDHHSICAFIVPNV